MEHFDGLDVSPFNRIKDTEKLKQILSQRLPRSANVYAMVLLSNRFHVPVEMAFFTLDVDSRSENCWIVATYFREDQGVKYNISAPQNAAVTEQIKCAFSNSNLINWTQKCNFSAIDRNISKFLWEIIVCQQNNVATITPTHFYYMDNAAAREINLEIILKNFCSYELKRLDPEAGSKFFCRTWPYSQDKSEISIRKILERNESAGIYLNDKIVCGANINGSGLMGMLHTLPEYRNKGFATLVMKSLMRQLAVEGLVPCCAIDMKNVESKTFHENLSMKFSHVVDFIRNTP